MVERELALVKLGGSVVTYKESSVPRLRRDVIEHIAHEVKKVLDKGKYSLILVHGAGSFGHPLAKKYELHKGMKTEEQKIGLGLTTQSMLRLNALIMKELIEAGVPTVGIPPHALARQSAGKLKSFEYGIVEQFLDQGFVPVLFGDVVLDDKWGCSILSGDVIVPFLAQKLKAQKAVFLSDVDGIFDADPKRFPNARRIPEIHAGNLKQVLESFHSQEDSTRADVTGEMQGKILAIKDNLSGITVYIANGLKKGNFTRVLEGNNVGTVLQFN